MTDLESAVVEIASVLEELGIPYMLIGGIAVALSGEPRATLDVDVSVWLEDPGPLIQRLHPIPARPEEFAARTRVLPVSASNGVRADLVLASLPFEREAIARARPKQIDDRTVMVAAAEDLVLMKLVSERAKDRDDAVRLLRRYRGSLDSGYLEPRLKELAEALAMPEILEVYRRES